jgi:predicted nucleic acid-binding protein
MVLVVDSSVLSTFARARRLPLLERLTADFERVTTTAVVWELRAGIGEHPALTDAVELTWLPARAVESLDEVRLFAAYAARLVAGTRNVGEASVLAWAEAHGAAALIDDQVAVQLGRARRVTVKRSLALIARGIRRGLLRREEGVALVDELIKAGGRFPCTGATFIRCAEEQALLGP